MALPGLGKCLPRCIPLSYHIAEGARQTFQLGYLREEFVVTNSLLVQSCDRHLSSAYCNDNLCIPCKTCQVNFGQMMTGTS